MRKPVILLAFANDPGNPIPEVVQESKALQTALEVAAERGLCELVVRESLEIPEVFDTFENPQYSGRIAVFHYAGHANADSLWLSEADGSGRSGQPAYKEGLASFLGRQKGLKLVFLNACSTLDHVQLLLEQGVPTVIATNQEIDDGLARGFATQFYRSLGRGKSIHEAYQTAVAAGQTQVGSPSQAYRRKRDIGLPVAEPPGSEWPWSLYPAAGPGLNWRLRQGFSWPRGLALAGVTAVLVLLAFFFLSRQNPPELNWPAVAQGNENRCLVAVVQYLLNNQDLKVGIDGVFAEATAAGVRSFQQSLEQEANGVVDTPVWERLVVALAPKSTAKFAIQALQMQLNNLGLDVIEEDGVYGQDTLRAVQKLKRSIGLEDAESGLVWLQTWQVLLHRTATSPCTRSTFR